MNMKELQDGKQVINSIVSDYTKKLVLNNIRIKKSLLLDFPHLYTQLNETLLSHYIKKREKNISRIKDKNIDIYGLLRELYEYSIDMLSRFKEDALRDNLIIFCFKILRENSENDKFPQKVRTYLRDTLKHLLKTIEPDLRGRCSASVDKNKLKNDYYTELKWLKKISEKRSAGNIKLYLKKRYSKFIADKDVEKVFGLITSTNKDIRGAAIIAAAFKNNRTPSQRIKDWLSEANLIERVNRELFLRESTNTILGRKFA